MVHEQSERNFTPDKNDYQLFFELKEGAVHLDYICNIITLNQDINQRHRSDQSPEKPGNGAKKGKKKQL